MHFASDNCGPVHPKVLNALAEADEGFAKGYGNDPVTEAAREAVRAHFEAPDAAVYFVATGTAANTLLLATLTKPWETIFATPMAHVVVDECNGPEFYTGGAKLRLVEAHEGRMSPVALAAAMAETGRSVHDPQTGPVTLTQVTETGTIYGLDALKTLAGTAREKGAPIHLDGARFANAQVALGCTAAEMSWRAGIDAVSFGGTKNGCMGVEACVIFDPELAWEFELRRKRAGHLFSKHRYLAAQMNAYLKGDLWRDLAKAANATATTLAEGLGGRGDVEILYPVEANMIFARLPRALHRRLSAGGAVYYAMDGTPEEGPDDELVTIRLVADWSTGQAGAERLLALL